ncbi:MAG: DUF3570 domain-containing protein [Candidatus Dadabacteria bacterium]|nr:MAG: DUF3570 domain-containing protein [Candidatus Dadabacteria bacterium]
MPENTTFRFKYTYYKDWQGGKKNRITVKAPMLWFEAPLAENTSIEGSFVIDTVSGASALYHDTLTGASGKGIEDQREAGDFTVTQYFENFSISAGAGFSSEDDYDSLGGNLVTRVWSDDKNTTLTLGIQGSNDEVRSTNNPELSEFRGEVGALIGITQVLDPDSLVQSNIALRRQYGYLSDPYKPFDSRPDNRTLLAWLTRYVHYVESFDASLHVDYRFYNDNWGISSHMFEVAWYQPLGEDERWLIRPSIRYYTQSEADFFSTSFPPVLEEGDLYTADQRLSGFGRFSFGFKVIRDFGHGFSADLALFVTYTANGMRAISPGTPGMDDLVSSYILLGFSKEF